MAIRIAICDDIPQIRNYFASVISGQEDMELVGLASSGEEIVELAKEQPDIILMDIQMETEKAGITATKIIKEKYPDIKVIIITVHEEDEYIFEAYVVGAVDYMLKTIDAEEICKGIRDVYGNVEFIRPYVAKKIMSGAAEMYRMKQSFMYVINMMTNLTSTELEILKALYFGKSRKDIAKERFIEADTVKFHIRRILRKLKYKSTKDMIKDLNQLQIFENFYKEI